MEVKLNLSTIITPESLSSSYLIDDPCGISIKTLTSSGTFFPADSFEIFIYELKTNNIRSDPKGTDLYLQIQVCHLGMSNNKFFSWWYFISH